MAELLDADREVLLCTPLSCDCDEVGHHCWPKHFRSALPYPTETRWLLVWEDERKLHEEWIPRPPRVVVEETQQDGDLVILHWRGEREGDDDDAGCCELWYLVQWFDAAGETWRGVAPRTRATALRLPRELLLGRDLLQLRILASCGIATGMATLEVRGSGQGEPTLQIVMQRDQDTLGNQITAVLVGPGGRHLPIDTAGWIVGGREIAHGVNLDLRLLPQGSSEVRAFVRGTAAGGFSRSWTIRRDGGSFLLEQEGPGRRSAEQPAEPHTHPHPSPTH